MAGLVMNNISHAFGTHKVLNDVSIKVEAGQVACLLGPSGCGKTTLLRITAGLERLQHGTVSINDQLMAQDTKIHTPPEARNVGLMFQDYALFPHLTIEENIGFGVEDHSADRRQWINSSLDRMGLSGYADYYPHELSGGQQQRVALLRALAPNPTVLLLDEPFSGLDVTRRAMVREQTLNLLKDTQHTALMVSHDPEEAMFMSDVILVMNDGKLVQSGAPIDIYRHPVDAFVAGLFGQVDRMEATIDNDGRAVTAVGSFPAGNLAPGTPVEVLIRPEGVSASSDVGLDTTALNVISARPIGRSSHLCLSPDNTDEGIIHARIPGIFLPDPGSQVQVTIDPSQVFIFPR